MPFIPRLAKFCGFHKIILEKPNIFSELIMLWVVKLLRKPRLNASKMKGTKLTVKFYGCARDDVRKDSSARMQNYKEKAWRYLPA